MNQYQKAAEYLDNRYNEGLFSLPCSVDSANAYISSFQNEFSPKRLLEIPKDEILRRIMLPNCKSSMINELISEEDDNPSDHLGHIGRQFYNNLPLAVSKESSSLIKIGRGMPSMETELLSFHEAESVAISFVKRMAEACIDINIKELQSIKDYVALGVKLERYIGKQANHAWFHKYLYFMFPDYFTNFHTQDYRYKALLALGIKPEKGFYAMAGQWAEIRKYMKLKDAYVIARVFYGDPKLMTFINGNEEKKKKSKKDGKLGSSDSRNDNEDSVMQESFKTPPGIYGNWQVVNTNVILLDVPYGKTSDGAFELPSDIEKFFPNENVVFNETYLASITERNTEKHIVFDEEFCLYLQQYADECQSGIVIVFERKATKAFNVTLRPGQKMVIEKVPEKQIEQARIDEYEDELQVENNILNLSNNYIYECVPEKKKTIEEGRIGKGSYPRDPQKRSNALIRAHYSCELDAGHASFISKTTMKPYMETHHLIPIEYWQSFDNSLDVEANIVCLCSNCHNQIHYGVDSDSLITKLYEKRKDELKQAGIGISLSQLLKIYAGEYEKRGE